MSNKLLCLGSGDFSTINNFHSSFLLCTDSGNLLIDCGGDVRRSLHNIGLSYKDIDAVYISHCHDDHCGGLEWLAVSKFIFDNERISLFAADSVVKKLSKKYDGCLKKEKFLEYFNVLNIPNFNKFMFGGSTIYLQKFSHADQTLINKYSYGLFIESEIKTLITTDVSNCSETLPFIEKADLVFHDCEMYYDKDGNTIKSGVHTHLSDLIDQIPDTQKNKIWLYHYDDESIKKLTINKFGGVLTPGKSFNI